MSGYVIPFILGLLGGIAGWTLLEYIIHCVLGHWPKGKTLVSREHLAHHKDILYFSPLSLKIRGAVPVLGGAGFLLWLALGLPAALGATLALSIGWTTYEALHKSIHVRGPRTWYDRWAAKNHLYHHFMKPNRNHGVTSPLWDILLGTHDRVDVVQVREKELANIPWLAKAFAHPASAPDYINDYALKQPRMTHDAHAPQMH